MWTNILRSSPSSLMNALTSSQGFYRRRHRRLWRRYNDTSLRDGQNPVRAITHRVCGDPQCLRCQCGVLWCSVLDRADGAIAIACNSKESFRTRDTSHTTTEALSTGFQSSFETRVCEASTEVWGARTHTRFCLMAAGWASTSPCARQLHRCSLRMTRSSR